MGHLEEVPTMRIMTTEEWDVLMDSIHEDNNIAHWEKMFSWVKDKKFRSWSSSRATRGYHSASRWYCSRATVQDANVGFRPAFEVMVTDALPSDIQDGEVAVVGTLYMGGKPVRVPQNPTWDGDVEDYRQGEKLELRPAEGDPLYQVKAIKVGDVFIADRNLLKNISYLDIEKALSMDFD